jgi:hypothetical protein
MAQYDYYTFSKQYSLHNDLFTYYDGVVLNQGGRIEEATIDKRVYLFKKKRIRIDIPKDQYAAGSIKVYLNGKQVGKNIRRSAPKRKRGESEQTARKRQHEQLCKRVKLRIVEALGTKS